jgi:hypothetical protein
MIHHHSSKWGIKISHLHLEGVVLLRSEAQWYLPLLSLKSCTGNAHIGVFQLFKLQRLN